MWKTLNPIWQTLILILLIAGAVPTIYFCGYKSSAKKAEAEKAEVIATYQASALVAEQLYTEKLKAANEEKQRWFDSHKHKAAIWQPPISKSAAKRLNWRSRLMKLYKKDGNRF